MWLSFNKIHLQKLVVGTFGLRTIVQEPLNYKDPPEALG